MAENCVRHTFDVAHAHCRECGHAFCTTCLVYAFGPAKPAFCVKCAIVAAGVRSNAAPTRVRSKKETRRLHKEHERTSAQAARVGAAARSGGSARLEGTAAATSTGSGPPPGRDPSPAPDGSGVIPAPVGASGVNRLTARFRRTD